MIELTRISLLHVVNMFGMYFELKIYNYIEFSPHLNVFGQILLKIGHFRPIAQKFGNFFSWKKSQIIKSIYFNEKHMIW